MNLIEDEWIPVVCRDGTRRIIAPWQIADDNILRPDWPRADLNIACLELLIGLVYMADPPADIDEWEDRQNPSPERLKEKLQPYAPAFNLLGDGSRFMQDLEKFDGDISSPDLLLIDSAGTSTAIQNKDLMVHRDRYDVLDLPLAAMALYTLQANAPSGGAGILTSMRGGGPLVTLIDPDCSLWGLVWSNIPDGEPGNINRLPWMQKTQKEEQFPPAGKKFNFIAFFGMPRRIRLISKDGLVTGVIQKPRGNVYTGWVHPLSPYYRQKVGSELLPKHPRAERFSYRNWGGVIARKQGDALTELAEVVRNCRLPADHKQASIIVAGWAMSNATPVDYVLSKQPYYKFSDEQVVQIEGMIEAAEAMAVALVVALGSVLSKGKLMEVQRETFFLTTETAFYDAIRQIHLNNYDSRDWFRVLSNQALSQFDEIVLPAMDNLLLNKIEPIVKARGYLKATFGGATKQGKQIYKALGFDLPKTGKRKAA